MFQAPGESLPPANAAIGMFAARPVPKGRQVKVVPRLNARTLVLEVGEDPGKIVNE